MKSYLGTVLTVCSVAVLAQPVVSPGHGALLDSYWRASFSAMADSYREEDQSASFLMEQHGGFVGLHLDYEAHRSDRWMWALQGAVQAGNLDYTSRDTGSEKGDEDWLIETRFLTGYDLAMGATVITPYAGFGYRYLSDDSVGQHSTTGASGYLRKSNYQYMPLGAKVFEKIGAWQSIFTAEYDVFIVGDQYSYIGGGDPLHNRQYGGYGWRTSWAFAKPLTNADAQWFIEPFYVYWHIRASEVNCKPGLGCGIEPDNTTHQFGVRLGLQF